MDDESILFFHACGPQTISESHSFQHLWSAWTAQWCFASISTCF